MAKILISGGGLAGCTAALELAGLGIETVIIEKEGTIGGKVVDYGCKAADKCTNCGLCLTSGLFEKVADNPKIDIVYNSYVSDLTGAKGNFSAVVEKTGNGSSHCVDDISAVIVAAGFKPFSGNSTGNIEMDGDKSRIITGSMLEKIISGRRMGSVSLGNGSLSDFGGLSGVAFIQCHGSRDSQEKAMYCSRVCCGYSTRIARVLKQYYPDLKITFFYMDLQKVEQGQYQNMLTDSGFGFVRCRPVRVSGSGGGGGGGNDRCTIVYEQGGNGIKEMQADLVVLSEGIHPPEDAGLLSEIFMLGVNENGFLKSTGNPIKTGIFLSGCVKGPEGIAGTHADAVSTARLAAASLGLGPASL